MPKKFDKEFKLNAVQLVLEDQLPLNQVSHDLGVGVSTLERWVREVKQHGREAVFPGKGYSRPEDEKCKRLLHENEILRRERDILKKALTIFSSR